MWLETLDWGGGGSWIEAVRSWAVSLVWVRHVDWLGTASVCVEALREKREAIIGSVMDGWYALLYEGSGKCGVSGERRWEKRFGSAAAGRA